jgi:hypothetical protein
LAGKYQRTITVHAFQWGVDKEPDWFKQAQAEGFRVEEKNKANQRYWNQTFRSIDVIFVGKGDYVVFGDGPKLLKVLSPEKMKLIYQEVKEVENK